VRRRHRRPAASRRTGKTTLLSGMVEGVEHPPVLHAWCENGIKRLKHTAVYALQHNASPGTREPRSLLLPVTPAMAQPTTRGLPRPRALHWAPDHSIPGASQRPECERIPVGCIERSEMHQWCVWRDGGYRSAQSSLRLRHRRKSPPAFRRSRNRGQHFILRQPALHKTQHPRHRQ
jgi:hypothetical protein